MTYPNKSCRSPLSRKSSKLKSHNKLAFQERHVLKFSLEITQRDPRTLKVCSVQSRFCSFFGGEEIIEQQRDRKQTENVKNWTVFRKEYYRDHHRLNHNTRWAEYERLSTEDKETYFTDKTRFKNTISSHFGQSSMQLIYKIDATIVDKIIGEMLFHPDEQDGMNHTNLIE